jgi:2'-5' RNA ligase
VAAARAPFKAELSGVGAFPSIRQPEVIWLGIETGREALADLAAATETACAALGWAREEKPFRAHLTLGRSRARHSGPRPGGSAARPPAPSAYRADLIRGLEAEGDTTLGFLSIERLVLVQSQLQPGGPVYTLLESFPLQRRESE